MRIVSWNVNGLHTTLKDATHRFSSTSAYFSNILLADIVCFQEAKIQEEKLEKWMACVPGFESFWAFSEARKGYSGVVTYVKDDLSPLDAAAEKLSGDVSATEDLCREGRILETDHGSFVLINIYVPNAGDREEGRPRLDFKVRFLQALRRKCDELISSGRHVVVVGDFNIAHKAIDVHRKWNVEEIYSSEEKDWLDSFLTDYVDLFRHFHPDVKDVFSVWEAKTDARSHNEGLRIDFAACDKGFLPQVKDTQILKMVPKNWSDHAAVILTLQEQPALPPHPASSISSRNMKRFQEDRRQKKLTSLFSRGASKPMAASSTGGVVPIMKGNLKQGNASVSSSVTPESASPSSEASSLVGKDVKHYAERQQDDISPTQDAGVSSQNTSTNTTDPSIEAGGTDVGPHLALESAQENQQEDNCIEQSDGKYFNIQGENGEPKLDGPDSNIQSKDEVIVIVSTSEPQLDVEATTLEAGRSLPLKRKQPTGSPTESGPTTGKQRNLTSYFKVTGNESETCADEHCKETSSHTES